MKVLLTIALGFCCAGSPAFGQYADLYLSSTDINLNSSSTVTLVSTTPAYGGYLSAIACTVTTAPTTSGNMYLTVQLSSGTTLTLNVYSTGSTAWHTDVLPYAGGSNGGNVGDSFVIPFPFGGNFSSLSVLGYPDLGTGHLRCSVSYNVIAE